MLAVANRLCRHILACSVGYDYKRLKQANQLNRDTNRLEGSERPDSIKRNKKALWMPVACVYKIP